MVSNIKIRIYLTKQTTQLPSLVGGALSLKTTPLTRCKPTIDPPSTERMMQGPPEGLRDLTQPEVVFGPILKIVDVSLCRKSHVFCPMVSPS